MLLLVLYVGIVFQLKADGSFTSMSRIDDSFRRKLEQPLFYAVDEFVEVRKIDEDHAFYDHLNPFNRFLLKKTIFKCPPPIIRSFSTSMVMAARLFSNKPMHATAFQKIAVILSQILQSFDLTLQICHAGSPGPHSEDMLILRVHLHSYTQIRPASY